MRTTTKFFAVIVCASMLSASSAEAQSSGDQARRVWRSRGTPIQQLLRPSDHAIVVVDPSDGGLTVDPADGSGGTLRHLTSIATLVALIQITEKTPRLTARGDWIYSLVSGRVLDVVQESSPSGLVAGGTMSIREEGGELVIDGRRVLADPREPQMIIGRRYLVFVAALNGTVRVPKEQIFEVTDWESLRRLKPRSADDRLDDIENHGVADVVARVRQVGH